ncbi:MAG: PfkB family carbohydrate kinase [Planctomycetota bacterium]|nr:PfkB family carbohydrate kinase [Planctomycetota bacterium]
MPSGFTIVGLGEALYDVFPDKRVLGGAPLNLAVHAHQLASVRGGRGVVVSRVGHDDLGRQIAADLLARGMTSEFLQPDPDRATGKVYVGLDAHGQPEYDIVRDVAWDWLSFDFDLEQLAQTCEAICFGSLAQRCGQSRNTIYRVLGAAKQAVRLFDVNLRQNYFDRSILHRSCEFSTAVKLNDHELPVVAAALGLGSAPAGASPEAAADAQATALLKRYKLKLVALTRGEKGTVLYSPAGKLDAAPVSYAPEPGADPVGAGDACAAGLLVGMLLRWPLERTLALANHTGALVAARSGATPKLPPEILAMVA